MDNISNHTVLRQAFSWLQISYKDIFSDHYAKKLYTGQTIFLYLEAMMKQRKSNDEIADNLKAKKWLQKWLQLDPIVGSSLYRKLELIPLDLVKDIFETIVQEIGQHYADKQGPCKLGKLSVVDSTEIKLPATHGLWAYVSSSKNAIKMHTCLEVVDKSSCCVKKVVLSTGAVSDHHSDVMQALIEESKNTYVLDRGYIRYDLYQKWILEKRLFVTRIKMNNKFRILYKRDVAENSHVQLDADVEFTGTNKEVFKLRLVEYTYVDKKNVTKTVRVVTNRWDLKAEEISEIYRYRWQVELYFKWMKQHASLKKLYNTKQNTVWVQVYLSLIIHALCELIRLTKKPELTCWEWLQLLNLYAEAEVEHFLAQLFMEPMHTSKGRLKKAKRGRKRIHPIKRKAVQIIFI